ncbi:MOSC domain-containing protein [soil metagenome]
METIDSLFRYPVKSMMGEQITSAAVTARGLAGDRAYALVDKATNRAAVVRTWATPLMSYRAIFDAEPQPDQPPPAIRITHPDGATWSSADADSDARFSTRFNRPLSLMSHAPAGLLLEFPAGTAGGKMADVTEVAISSAAPPGTFFDVASIHLITTATLERIQSAYPQGRIDVRRFRPNIVVTTDAEPFAENGWADRRFAIGEDLVLKGFMPTPRCVNTTIPQADLPRDGGILKALAQLNAVDFGDSGHLPCAGLYANVERSGRIRPGDTIRWLD